jgi:hypothetical protein
MVFHPINGRLSTHWSLQAYVLPCIFYIDRAACQVATNLVAVAADKIINQATKSPVQANGQHRNGTDDGDEYEEYEQYHEEVEGDLGEGILG